MAKMVWAVLCTKASIDMNSNNVSLFEVLEQVQRSPSLPLPAEAAKDRTIVVPIQADFAVSTMRSDFAVPEEGQGRFHLVSPDGQRLAGGEFKLELKEHRRCRTIARM